MLLISVPVEIDGRGLMQHELPVLSGGLEKPNE
jgi:hypothetical protein